MAKFILKMGGFIHDEPDGVDGDGKPKFKERTYICAKPGAQPTVVESDKDLVALHGSDKFQLYERPAPMRIPPRPKKALATRDDYETWLDTLSHDELKQHAAEREIDSTGTQEELLARLKEQ